MLRIVIERELIRIKQRNNKYNITGEFGINENGKRHASTRIEELRNLRSITEYVIIR